MSLSAIGSAAAPHPAVQSPKAAPAPGDHTAHVAPSTSADKVTISPAARAHVANDPDHDGH